MTASFARARWVLLGCALAVGVALGVATVASASPDAPSVDGFAIVADHDNCVTYDQPFLPKPGSVCLAVDHWETYCEDPSPHVEARLTYEAEGSDGTVNGKAKTCRDSPSEECREGEEYRVNGHPVVGVCLVSGTLYPCEVGYENVGYVVVSGMQVDVPACVDVPGPVSVCDGGVEVDGRCLRPPSLYDCPSGTVGTGVEGAWVCMPKAGNCDRPTPYSPEVCWE